MLTQNQQTRLVGRHSRSLRKAGLLLILLVSQAAAQEKAGSGAADAGAGPFDFTEVPGEHPLAPVVRVMEGVLADIDKNIADYSCTLTKQERIDGELGDPQHIFLKVRNEPFSVYMRFLQPYQGREVLYVAGQNNGKLVALDGGFKRNFGKLNLDPEGTVAMNGQKYPITRVGIRNLVAEYIRTAEADMKYGECQVSTDPNQEVDGRPATLIQAMHPVPRREFRGYMARVFLDNELRVPIHYDAYTWPEQQGKKPPLIESYTYRELKINNGFTAQDFDKDNPQIFQ
jgi:hypothetical protein